MSWDKNTVKLSNLDGYIDLLIELNIPYIIETIGEVKGCGCNDFDEEDKKYSIRKLTVQDLVFIEQMQRTSDCDCDDYLVLLKFPKNNVPLNIPLEITQDLE